MNESPGDSLVIHRMRFWVDDPLEGLAFPRPLVLPQTHVEVSWRPRVSWRPQAAGLHYQALYRGVYEWLRAPPRAELRGRAEEYLVALGDGTYGGQLQRDRIRWTQEWLRELEDEQYWSDSETVAHDDSF